MCVSSNFPKDKSDPTSHFCSYKLLQSSHDPLIKTENLTNMTFRIIYYLVLAYFSRFTSSLLHLSHSKRHVITAAAAAKLRESCPSLCDSIDCSPPGTPVPGILQARTLEWVAISFSNAWKWKVKSESEVAQSCPTLCYPTDCSPPGSSIHGIFQARVLEWGIIAFSSHHCYPSANSSLCV